ncbi:MAG: metal ABC transporter permease [Nitrospinaceae bacterium]
MTDFLTIMAAPGAACLILSIIYTYFGIHVLKREILFVDLSLAQLAALGTTVAFILDRDPDSGASLLFSMVFVIGGALFFTATRPLTARVPQEAIIGIVYVVAASVALLLVTHAPHGAEHIKTLLNGSILWMSWEGVLKLFGVVLGVALVHWFVRNRMESQSEFYKKPPFKGDSSFTWDFLFYGTLGLVIIFSVRTAGIFLVFTFLIIPAVCGALVFRSLRGQFIVGSCVGITASLGGLMLSFFLDLPTGATLVCTFGAVFLIFLLGNRFQGPP